MWNADKKFILKVKGSLKGKKLSNLNVVADQSFSASGRLNLELPGVTAVPSC